MIIQRKNYLILNCVLLVFIFIVLGLYLSQVILSAKYNFELRESTKELELLQAENDYLNKKIIDENTIVNLFETSEKLGLVKISNPEYILTTGEVFVAK